MSKLSHIDDQGRASMVDVSDKDSTERLATAEAIIALPAEAYRLVVTGTAKKGDVLATARIAGIMAAKKTSELIPLCHPLALSHVGSKSSRCLIGMPSASSRARKPPGTPASKWRR